MGDGFCLVGMRVQVTGQNTALNLGRVGFHVRSGSARDIGGGLQGIQIASKLCPCQAYNPRLCRVSGVADGVQGPHHCSQKRRSSCAPKPSAQGCLRRDS